MKFVIRGDKLEITEAIKNYIEEKLSKLNKYFSNPEEISANVVVRVRGIDQIVEVTIPIQKTILRAENKNKDLYATIDLVVEKLERQIRKNKTRMHRRNNRPESPVFTDFEIEEDMKEGGIVKRKTFENKPMSEEEAILQMNLLGHDFFIFNNSETNTISVLYRREDGDFGIIDMKN